MNKTRSAVTVAAIAVVTVTAVAGVWLVDWREAPSDSDIREAAAGLVPSGADVTDETAGPQGSFPEEGPYRAFLEYRSTGDRVARLATVRAHAEAQGWTVTDSSDLPGAAVLELEKDTLSTRLSILDSGQTRISTGRGEVATATRLSYAAVVLAVGAAALAAVWTASRGASKAPAPRPTTQPQKTTPPLRQAGDQHAQPPFDRESRGPEGV